MQNKKNLLNRSIQLLSKNIYSKITNYKTFTHIRSIFKDPWYNYIIPHTTASKLDWKESQKIILTEKESGYSVSYYIDNQFYEDYKDKLEKKEIKEFGTDVYLFKKLKEKYELDEEDFQAVNSANLEDYISLAKTCFPDYENEEEYTRYFYDLNLRYPEKYKNILLRKDAEIAAFGSVILSPELNLAYFHNTGTSPKYRRKGLFTQIVKKRSNLSCDSKITEVYAIVEENCDSYHGLKKLGFEEAEKFHFFA